MNFYFIYYFQIQYVDTQTSSSLYLAVSKFNVLGGPIVKPNTI